jgi:hypothetical protein
VIREVGTKFFLLRVEDLASLDVIRSLGYDTSGPKLMKNTDKRDRAVVVHPSGVPFFYIRIVCLSSHKGDVTPVIAMD